MEIKEKMEEKFDFLNIDQEDDNLLLAVSPADALFLGVTPPSPAVVSCKKKRVPSGQLENCSGEAEGARAMVVADTDLDVKPVPKVSSSPTIPSSVLSVLDLNSYNKLNINRDILEDTWSRRGQGTKDSMQLEGIAEASPVKNPGTFTSKLSRSYLDIESELAGETPEKGGGEPTILRRSRTRRSTTLRKSLAWDKAFFTDEGVLDNEELFAVASDTPKALPMPELATIWDGPQTLIAPFEAVTTTSARKGQMQPVLAAAPELPKIRDVPQLLNTPFEAVTTSSSRKGPMQPEMRSVVASKPHQDPAPSSSGRPMRQIHTTGSHAFSNAYSRAAAIPQGSTSIPLPTGLLKTSKQPAGHHRHHSEHALGSILDVKEPRSTATGLHHQARIAALKKAHEAPPQKGPRIRLPSSISSKKVEEKPIESHKGKQPVMARSLSTPALQGSPSSLSRKVSSMSQKVKDTLGRVMTGRAHKSVTAPSSPHMPSTVKTSLFSKKSGALPSLPETKDSSSRAKTLAATGSEKPTKGVYTVRDMLRGKGPHSILRENTTQGPTLTRSKSAFTVPGLPRSSEHVPTRVVASPAHPPTEPPLPAAKPTGLRKPSPKLGFFDSGRTSLIPQKTPFQGSLPARPGSEASNIPVPLGSSAHPSQGLSSSKYVSAIPNAPHLRYGVASAPSSPRGARVLYTSSPQSHSIKSTRPSTPYDDPVALPLHYSVISHARQFAESHQHIARKLQLGGADGIGLEPADLDSFKLPDSVLDTIINVSDKTDVDSKTKDDVKLDENMHSKSIPSFTKTNYSSSLGSCSGDAIFSQQHPGPESVGGEIGNMKTVVPLLNLGSSDAYRKDSESSTVSESAREVQIKRLTSKSNSVHDILISSQFRECPREPGRADTDTVCLAQTTGAHSSPLSSGAINQQLQSSASQFNFLTSSHTKRIVQESVRNPASQSPPEFLEVTNSQERMDSEDMPSGLARQCERHPGVEQAEHNEAICESKTLPPDTPSAEAVFDSSKIIGEEYAGRVSHSLLASTVKSTSEYYQNVENENSLPSSSPNERAGCEASADLQVIPLAYENSQDSRTEEMELLFVAATESSHLASPSPPANGLSEEHSGQACIPCRTVINDAELRNILLDCPEDGEVSVFTGLGELSSPSGRKARRRSTRDSSTRPATPCEQPEISSRVCESTPKAGPTTPKIKESPQITAMKTSRQFESPRSRSFRETSTRVVTPTSSPAGTRKFVRSSSFRQPWQSGSPGSRIGGDSSPNCNPSTPISAKNASIISPCHAPDAGGSFETLTPTSSKSARGVRTPDGSANKVVRKIVEFESPSSHWSDWPVLGAAIPADQVPASGKKEEGSISVPPRPPRDQPAEALTELRPVNAANLMNTPSKGRPIDVDCVTPCESRAVTSASFVNTPSSKGRPAEVDSATYDRNPLAGLNVADVPGSNKKEKGSSFLNFAKKAVGRLTLSPIATDPSGQENGGTPRSQKSSRRMSRSSSLATETKVLAPYSEDRICAIEAAGVESLQKKSGAVQNSPPDKIVTEPNPWSPVRKNVQELGPFDCTKLKYIDSGIPIPSPWSPL